ncbi:polyserase-related [Holotrichia oblita]|uniref:Polyserase-related n=1 Tax=Holotrichia oblita TaxID=644536 RepID=A0ACB9SYQ3_HOLOL|nr:polyserase-related [Holotrichia oblita]
MFVVTLITIILFAVVICDDFQDGKIIGGTVADISKYPFVVSLNLNGEHFCGGAIIGNEYVLTAAHCLEDISPNSLTVFAGSKYRTLPRQRVLLNSTKMHERYNNRTTENDIAILKLKNKLEFGRRVLPIALPAQNEEVTANISAVTLGWGYITEYGPLSTKLRKITVPIIDRQQCRRLYSSDDITNTMICAGVLKGGKDSCGGDSGGPLVANGKLTGIVSWGRGCGRKGYPGVYTQVSKFRNWIKIHTNI